MRSRKWALEQLTRTTRRSALVCTGARLYFQFRETLRELVPRLIASAAAIAAALARYLHVTLKLAAVVGIWLRISSCMRQLIGRVVDVRCSDTDRIYY